MPKEHNQSQTRVHAADEDTLYDDGTVYRVQQKGQSDRPPYEITHKVNSHPVEFELDSGTSSTLAPESAIRGLTTLLTPQVGQKDEDQIR